MKHPAKKPPAPPPITPPITKEIVAGHGLSEAEYMKVVKILGREPNLTELGVFSVMWSEHCSYKSSKMWLKKLPTKAKWVIQGPGENVPMPAPSCVILRRRSTTPIGSAVPAASP